MERRYDIDWLRVMAIGLLVIYHIAIGFQPWGVFIRFIQNDQPLEVLWIPMSMLNVWRIPLLFWVSGMGVAFAMRKRNWKTLLLERIRRILLPFIAGMLLVVPLHILLWQSYYRQALTYTVKPGHLWFLANIFAYALLLMPVYFLLKKHRNGPLSKFLVWVFGNPLGPAVIILFFALEARILNPDLFEMYAMTTHGFILGLMAFFFGYVCIYSGGIFWEILLKFRWLLLALALAVFLIRLMFYDLRTPAYLMSIESSLWIFAVFGFAHKHLNKPGRALNYLRETAYPLYIWHMVYLYLGSYYIFPLDMDPALKFILLVMFTLLGAWSTIELIIQKVPMLRLMFGLKVEFSKTAHGLKSTMKTLSS